MWMVHGVCTPTAAGALESRTRRPGRGFTQERWRLSNESDIDCHVVAVVEVLEMTLATHMVAAVAAAGVAAGSAWWVQAQRYGLQIEQLKHQQTGAQLAGARQAVADMAGFQKGLTDALDTFRATQQRNAQAQQDLGRLLLDLRGTTAGLRGDFAGLPDRIASAAQFNQDISALVGKVDIRMLEHFAQDDADAYSYSGALCKANQGMMEFVEMV